MSNELESLLELSSRQGASHAEVYQVTSQSQPVFFEGNRLKQLESSQSIGTALRLWQDNRPGLAVAYGKIDPELLVKKAIALAKLNDPEIIELAPPRTAIHNLEGATASVPELIQLGDQAITQLRKECPELICSAELESERETTILINSQGLSCQYSESALSYYLGAELVRGEDFLGIYDGEYTKDKLDLNSIVEQIIQRLNWAKQNVNPPQGKVPVLLTANAATLLWSTVSSALNGKRVKEKSSPWSDRLQQLVISEQISLSQQPDKLPYDCPFDDEGMVTEELNLINKGVLNQFYCDRTIARELNIQSTGNGFRPGLDTYPSPSLVNLIVNSGNASFAELIAQLNNGIIVDQLLGGGADISGDFSVNVDLGYRVENGKITGRIKDTAIAGNVYQILKQELVLGNDSIWNGSCFTPSIMVDGISVVG
ncbi:TldD/PmbA family protein [Waterburya agarophytonicola K14]|uniref:TldD/PmbA family protein n=1 Tax=Waterburya agarophytonicola KI4 TaxID=2874699 RepID=A0A964BPE2_9CYAN|nr:TldD/PmbA family protein [Waterburya agarophytonicola]MCC0176422.1 TldD/PmbA family protein [Waterburya agarophytonicola KI4]